MERTLWSDERIDDAMDRIDRRFDQVDARFDRLEARMDRLEARMDHLLHQMTTFALTQYAATVGIIITIFLRT
ncbi:MAG TPA: hypothetical protein VF715_04480 [Thermoleophilaceae bacterium]|jgi:prefoldin subunit 5